MSTNIQCPITGYEIQPKTNGIRLSTDCPLQPCKVIIFDFHKLKAKNVKARIVATTQGEGKYDSSQFELTFIQKTFPYYENPLKKIKISLGPKNQYTYTSPLILDPDNNLLNVEFTLTPEMICKCLRTRLVENQFEILIDQSRLSEKDVGSYKLQTNIKASSNNPIGSA